MLPAHATLLVASRRRRSRHGAFPRGFTLLELILVLALMVAVTALAGTNLRGTFRQQRLLKAAQQVRTEWTRARVQAIKTGRVQVFHHAPQTDQCMIISEQSVDDLPVELLQGSQGYGANLSSATGSAAMLGRGSSNGLDPSDPPDVRQRRLPEGVLFLGAEVLIDQRSVVQLEQTADPKIITQQLTGLRAAADQPDEWGMPIYFFPDGTSSTAQLIVANDRDERVCVYLRGLTGLVRVGNIERGNSFSSQEGPR